VQTCRHMSLNAGIVVPYSPEYSQSLNDPPTRLHAHRAVQTKSNNSFRRFRSRPIRKRGNVTPYQLIRPSEEV